MFIFPRPHFYLPLPPESGVYSQKRALPYESWYISTSHIKLHIDFPFGVYEEFYYSNINYTCCMIPTLDPALLLGTLGTFSSISERNDWSSFLNIAKTDGFISPLIMAMVCKTEMIFIVAVAWLWPWMIWDCTFCWRQCLLPIKADVYHITI